MLKHRKATIIGSGISGIAAARLLKKQGAIVTIYDSNEQTDRDRIRETIGDDCRISCGAWTEELAKETEVLVLSPGVPTDLPFIAKMRENGIPILGEVVLAYQSAKGKLIGITGTNGKTTTTALTGEIMRQYFKEVFVVGNIGVPYTEQVEKMTEQSVTVAELSSFQLETVGEDFQPDVSIILNITPDHLNRHHTMDNYIGAKLQIAKHQTANQTCILNYEDPILRERAQELSAAILWFSCVNELQKGLYLKGDSIVYSDGSLVREICKTDELHIIGTHNFENAMAAIGAAICMKIPFSCIKKGLVGFHAVEHRIEFVATKNGVDYYNDSKGTNPDAAIKGIQAMKKPTWLIAGGYDKGAEYEDWIRSFGNRVKGLVLIGQTKEKIAETATRLGVQLVVKMDDFEEAFHFCSKNAQKGEAVLLSPACASWGMFSNYEERGNLFKALVHRLPDKGKNKTDAIKG